MSYPRGAPRSTAEDNTHNRENQSRPPAVDFGFTQPSPSLPARYRPTMNRGGAQESYPPVTPSELQGSTVVEAAVSGRDMQAQESKLCCVCETPDKKAWKCVQCDDYFCEDCWPNERPHKQGKLGYDGLPHEQVDVEVVRRLEQTFNDATKDEQDDRHRIDTNTTWFGVEKDENESYLLHSNRLVEILQEQAVEGLERFPRLVSFVGQTEAGKSTVIKMLIERAQANMPDSSEQLCPVTGRVSDVVPTTGNVHLYKDPATGTPGQNPILYADSEGMSGGEHLPGGLAISQKAEQSKPKRISKKLRQRILWRNKTGKQSREFAVANLFPKILYTFSDVVVFALKEVRTFQSKVLTQLVDWAVKSIDGSLNQPVLPHIIIVINATDSTIHKDQWDPHHATQTLLNEYKNSVNQVPDLRAIASKLNLQGDGVVTTHDLLRRYYSSVTVLRIPTKGRYMQMDAQLGKLYDLIVEKSEQSHQKRKRVRMALNAERLPQYVNMAYGHFSRRIDAPFNFMEAARRFAPMPQGFDGHMLNLILWIAQDQMTSAKKLERLLHSLNPLIASCVMLAATLDKTQGSYSNIFEGTYQAPLKSCLTELCENHIICSFERKGLRCGNVKRLHDKGHQASTGKVIRSKEQYISDFDENAFFSGWIKAIIWEIDKFTSAIEEYSNGAETYYIHQQHRQIVAQLYAGSVPKSLDQNSQTPLTCLYCVRRIPENALPCGHSLCKNCVQSLGIDRGQGCFEMDSCPLHPYPTWTTPVLIRFKPTEAGVRVLALDGGGVRGIVELAILQAIEDQLGGHLPIQCFFDLIVGTSTGGIIALGLGVQQWRVADCLRRFKKLTTVAFSQRPMRQLALLSHKSWYKTRPLEAALKESFGNNSLLYGDRTLHKTSDIRVAVTSTSANENRPVVLSNYNTEGTRSNLLYEFVRPREPDLEFKVWEAARATSAAPPYFKSFVKPENGQAYFDGAIHHNCPVKVADRERKLLWEDVSGWPADVFLSLGTGLGSSERTNHHPTSNYSTAEHDTRQKLNRGRRADGLRLMLRAGSKIIDDQLNCEKAWDQYYLDATPLKEHLFSEERRRNLRINVRFPENRPALDDVKSLQFLETFSREKLAVDPDVIEVAHRLVASSFYFERFQGSFDSGRGVFHCFGNIRCRLPEGGYEIRALGNLFRQFTRGQSFTPHFFLQEDYQTPHQKQCELRIDQSTIQRMCNMGSFKLDGGSITINGSFQANKTRLSLRLQEQWYGQTHGRYGDPMQTACTEPYMSISGFPRELFGQNDSLPNRPTADEDAEEEFEDLEGDYEKTEYDHENGSSLHKDTEGGNQTERPRTSLSMAQPSPEVADDGGFSKLSKRFLDLSSLSVRSQSVSIPVSGRQSPEEGQSGERRSVPHSHSMPL